MRLYSNINAIIQFILIRSNYSLYKFYTFYIYLYTYLLFLVKKLLFTVKNLECYNVIIKYVPEIDNDFAYKIPNSSIFIIYSKKINNCL